MNYRIFKISILVLMVLTIGILSCSDESVAPGQANGNGVDSSGTVTGGSSTACADFEYADTIFYLREQSTDYTEAPLVAQTGTYGSADPGLEINSTTGVINVSQSETGLRYEVFFIPQGTTDSCKVSIIISGIDYEDHIYEINTNDTLAIPFYNAQKGLLPPCSDDDDDDDDEEDDDECEFDDGPDDDDGDGDDDEPEPGQEVIPQGVAIDKATGIIDVKKTLSNDVFGPNPTNGTQKDFRINYRLNDASNGTLNGIDVRLFYFEKRSDIPTSLLDEINERNSQTGRFGNGSRRSSTSRAFTERARRPRYIMIVGKLL
ncbi:hypothetical protein QQ020_04795 [Fulvivirgaceae bacterium BMA12]|uniref:Lipoprotein n=1 Tax=Agaribacillus aureus TaxID=3051825 RepID=A0ABT8L264_9BACT|nr:hypothetical protein [Fulvivirgaceae bacterium BMA12]